MKGFWTFVVIALLAITGLAIFELLTVVSIGVALLIAALFGAGVVIAARAQAEGTTPEVAAKQSISEVKRATREDPTVVKMRVVHEQLFRTNEALLFSGTGSEAVEPLRSLTTVLRTASERALTFAPDSTTTFNVIKLAETDLPALVDDFLALSEAEKKKNVATLAAQLAELETTIASLMEHIEAGNVDAFNAQSEFINVKFD